MNIWTVTGSLALLVFGIGVLSLELQWHKQVKTQQTLDACIAQQVRAFQKIGHSLDQINGQMERVRNSIRVALSLEPHFVPVLKAALRTLYWNRQRQQLQWKQNAWKWNVGFSCNARIQARTQSSVSQQYWINVPPDALGPRPFKPIYPKNGVYFEISKTPLHSSATLFPTSHRNWEIAWGKAQKLR